MNVCCLQSLRDTSPNRGSYLYQKRVVIYEKDAAVVSNANYFSMSFRVACDVNRGCGKLFIAQRLFFLLHIGIWLYSSTQLDDGCFCCT